MNYSARNAVDPDIELERQNHVLPADSSPSSNMPVPSKLRRKEGDYLAEKDLTILPGVNITRMQVANYGITCDKHQQKTNNVS